MTGKHKPKVVVIGGGTGMPVLLQGLKEYPVELTAVVTVADDGGSTGEIRNVINIPAPGDIRNVIAALANVDRDLYELFQYRIEGNNGLAGHALGNLLLAATNEITGDFSMAVSKIAELFNVKANVYPVVNEPVTLHAEMEDGTIVSGESTIPLKNKKINRIFLTPENPTPNRHVIEAIKTADLVVISPGSLYTSILPNLVIEDVIRALDETEATVVYVCNIMTQPGETIGYTASEHVNAIYTHTKQPFIDIIIVQNDPIDGTILQTYKEEGANQVVIDYDSLEKLGLHIIAENVVDHNRQIIRHNYKKISKILYNLV